MCKCFAGMYVCDHMYAWCPRSEKGISSPENGATDGYKLPCGQTRILHRNSQVFLTVAPSHHP